MTPHTRMAHNIMIVAGEASGDQRGAEVVQALKQKDPTLSFFGIGGSDMRAAGVDTVIDIHELAVMGFFEVIKHLPHLINVMRRTKALLLHQKPDLLILVDYPGFNLRLAKFAKEHGVKVLFYISPQVWAWRQGRVKKIAQVVDHMAVIFPFEKKFYEQHAVPVTYVGHPLTEKIKLAPSQTQARSTLGLPANVPVITLCPGSRYAELNSLLPIMLASAPVILAKMPNAVFIIAQASTIHNAELKKIITENKMGKITVQKITTDSLLAMSAADVIITASGTATLEAGLLNKPMVIVYKVSKATAFILKRMIKIPYISLANIVAGSGVVTELLQEQATAENIAQEALKLLEDSQHYAQVVEKLTVINRQLGDAQAPEAVASIALKLITE
jgi:lipid-A-disaccharide synthase